MICYVTFCYVMFCCVVICEVSTHESNQPVESKTRTYPGGPVLGGARRDGGAGQHRTPTTVLFAKEKTNSYTPQTMEE